MKWGLALIAGLVAAPASAQSGASFDCARASTAIERAICLILVARNLERLGDHATNIAENVHYLVTGQSLPVERPRGGDAANHKAA